MFIDKKRPSDYFIWKSNVSVNENPLPSNLVTELKQGRYLLETHQFSNCFIYLWILNDQYYFKHFICSRLNETTQVSANLNDKYNHSKKIMYQYKTSKDNDNSEITNSACLKKLRNDFNITSYQISQEQHKFLVNMLTESTKQLCESLKEANGFYFAVL